MKAFLLTVLLLPLLFSNVAYAEEPMVMEQVTPNGKVKVQLSWPEVLPDQLYNIDVRFLDTKTGQLLDNARITYDVSVLQDHGPVEMYHDQSTNSGEATFEVVFPEDGAGPARVIVAVTSLTNDSGTVQMREEVSFNVHVVPEFGIFSAMIMVFAIGLLLISSRLRQTLWS